jgi:hypothetical protein
LQGIFPRNLIHDPRHTLDGMLVLKCFFCNTFQTPIEYDMRVHSHQKKVTDLPLRGNGFNMDYRLRFAIDIMKLMRPVVFYNHRTAKFVSLDKSEMQKEALATKRISIFTEAERLSNWQLNYLLKSSVI